MTMFRGDGNDNNVPYRFWSPLKPGRKPLPAPAPVTLNAEQFRKHVEYEPTRGWSWVGITICGLSAVLVIFCIRLAFNIVFE